MPNDDGAGLPGMSIARREVFRAVTTQYDWHRQMLVALNTARGMGASRFEIEVTPERVEVKPQYLRVGGSGLWDDGHYQQTGTYEQRTQVITVYAVVVE